MTIPATTSPSKIIGISKLTLTAEVIIYNYASQTTNKGLRFGTLDNDADKFYLLIATISPLNFQSYYLTVADCTSRDANRVCQTCQAGLVRNNLMPDNQCAPAADYTGYVADTVNNLLSICPGNAAAPVGIGCRVTDCSGAGTTTACTTCDVANNFYLLTGVCYAYASIPNGYGIVTTGQQALQACADTNCVKCVAQRTVCSACNEANGYVLVTGTCHKLTIISTAVKPTKADVDLSWRQEIADTPIPVNKSAAYKALIANKQRYNLTVIDASDVSYSFTMQNYDSYVILDFTLPKGLPKEQYNVALVGFTFDVTDNGAIYKIQVMDGSTVYRPWVPETLYAAVQGLTSVAATSQGLTSTSTVLLMGVSPTAAVQGTAMGNCIAVLLMLSGPQIVLPELALRGTLLYMVPFSMLNYFEKWTASETCDLPDAFERNGIGCSIFDNYGEDLIVLMIALIVSLLVEKSVSKAKTTLSKDWKKTHLFLKWIQATFGLPFLIAKLEASQYEILAFSLYNILRSSSAGLMIVGDLVAIVLLGYFIYSMICQYLLAVWVWKELEKRKKVVHETMVQDQAKNGNSILCFKKNRVRLRDMIDLNDAPDQGKAYEFVFEEYRLSDQKYQYYFSVATGVRNFAFAIFIVTMQSAPQAQLAILWLVQTLYFCHTLVCNIKVSISLRIVDILTEGFLLVYFILKVITMLNISEDSRQKKVASLMVVCVYGIIVVSLCFALFSLLCLLFELCKKATELVCKKKRTQEAHNDLADQSRVNLQLEQEQAAVQGIENRQAGITNKQVSNDPFEVQNQRNKIDNGDRQVSKEKNADVGEVKDWEEIDKGKTIKSRRQPRPFTSLRNHRQNIKQRDPRAPI